MPKRQSADSVLSLQATGRRPSLGTVLAGDGWRKEGSPVRVMMNHVASALPSPQLGTVEPAFAKVMLGGGEER